MTRNRRSHVVFLTILGLSILLHVLAWKWLNVTEWSTAQQVKKTTKSTVEITLQPPPIAPQQELNDQKPNIETQPEEHPTQHNADSFASSNNTDKSVKSLTPGKASKPKANSNANSKEQGLASSPPSTKPSKPHTPIVESPKATDTPRSKPITSVAVNTAKPAYSQMDKPTSISSKTDTEIQPTKISSTAELPPTTHSEKVKSAQVGGSLSTEYEYQQPNTQIPDDMLAALGNMELLDDHNLSDIDVKDPYSKTESQRIKMVNRYLQRMEQQIKTGWVKPKQTNQQFSGVIKFSLTPYGQLTEAYIYLGSGNSELDRSALAAVKQVKRFAVPESVLVAAKYYNSLRFQYSSHDFSGETIPLSN